ncbi:hypothetical protein AB4Z14_14385 [Terrabacter sp. 2TAF16]|uniref:hypothetical protein n=1 Tax=Terrabacter sp. 2TAF16 TaxID=3233008 RepID=UPI003F9D410F
MGLVAELPVIAVRLETQTDVMAAPLEFAEARLARLVGALALEQIVVSTVPLAHALASAMAAESDAFWTERRELMTDPTSALIASMPMTMPHDTSTVTMMATAPRSRRLVRISLFSRRIA